MIVLLFLIFGSFGSQTATDHGVKNIKLECAEICKRMANPPFTEKTFEDAEDIKLIEIAINHAERIPGILDYGAFFIMHVSSKDGTQKNYVLNIADKAESTGLLVDLSNSSQGYTISQQTSIELRKIIYNH